MISTGAVADGSDDEQPGIATLIGRLFNWFRTNLGLMESDNRGARITYTAKRLDVPQEEAGIIALLQAAHPGITKIERLQIDPEFAERLEQARARLRNRVTSTNGRAAIDRG